MGFLHADGACGFWAHKLGCAGCKTADQVRADVRLQAFSSNLPPGRPKAGRVLACNRTLAEGYTVSSPPDGISYIVRQSSYWTQQ